MKQTGQHIIGMFFLCALLLLDCSGVDTEERVIFVQEAVDRAAAGREQLVRVQGFYSPHFEGDGLETDLNVVDKNKLLLIWYRDDGSARRSARRLGRKFVEVRGLLCMAPILEPMVRGDVPHIKVVSLEEAKPTSTVGTKGGR
jgi:hypothetical protein